VGTIFFTAIQVRRSDFIPVSGRPAPLLPRIAEALRGYHLNNNAIPRCVAYYEAFKKPDQPSAIYKAIESVLTYIGYARSRFKMEGYLRSYFYIPVILLDGQLFEASIEGDDVELLERDHIQLRTYYRHHLYIVDVVTKSSFDSFVKGVAEFHPRIVQAIGKLSVPPDVLGFVGSKYRGRI
jgi:hypothetical protein